MWIAMLGLLNGILMGLVYSVEELWVGVFFVLVPFAGIMMSKKKTALFLIGYGFGYYITGLSFLFKLTNVLPLPVYTSNVVLALAVFALSAYLTLLMWLAMAPFCFLKRGRGSDIFLLAALYTLGEWLPELVPALSFPWFRLAVVAVPAPLLIQGASLFGGLFVSFLIVLWNGLLARIMVKRRLEFSCGLAGILIGAVLLYGEVRLYQSRPQEGQQVLVVQGNHEGSEKWAMKSRDILEDYERLVYEYADSPVALVVLPETALPYAVADNQDTKKALSLWSRQLPAEILLGAIEREVTETGEERFYNAVYHVTEQGIDTAVYRKQVLVPFGEYLPFEEILGNYVPWLLDFMAGNYFEAGSAPVIFDTGLGRAGTLICYESVFSRLAMESVREGAQFLVIVSNDSWFQDTPAMREHHAHAILRAVEEDRYVIRAGNTGISSIIDNRGRVIAGIKEKESGGFCAFAAPVSELTIYAGAGDIFPAVLCGIYILLLLGHVCVLIFSAFSDIINKQYKNLRRRQDSHMCERREGRGKLR